MSDDENEGDEVVYQIVFEGEKQAKAFISKNGKAKATFPNNDVYDGEYLNGKRNGKGVYTWSKAEENKVRGAKYDGEYKDGKREGGGVMVYPDKSKYIGEWQNNARHGKGTYIYPNGDRYCGQWIEDKKKGAGTYCYAASQTQLTGTYDNDVCADGTWSYYDGRNFTCKFNEGKVVEYGDRQLTA